MKKVKGLRSTSWWLQNSHGDVNYSIGNIVSKVLEIKYGRGHFVKYMIV